MIDKNVSLEHKKVLITGVAGFIGANLAVSLLKMCIRDSSICKNIRIRDFLSVILYLLPGKCV